MENRFISNITEGMEILQSLHFWWKPLWSVRGGMWFHESCFYDEVYSRWKTEIWVKVFKNGPSKICGRQPLKILSNMVWVRQTISHLKFFKGCLSQILFDPLLNTSTHKYNSRSRLFLFILQVCDILNWFF